VHILFLPKPKSNETPPPMILTISSLLMMFANLMQQTKRIIQEKYLKSDNVNTSIETTLKAVETTDEQLNEKTQEMKDQIYGQYCMLYSIVCIVNILFYFKIMSGC